MGLDQKAAETALILKYGSMPKAWAKWLTNNARPFEQWEIDAIVNWHLGHRQYTTRQVKDQ